MEENIKCIYCNEIMTYGPQKQIMSICVIKYDKHISKSLNFILYGWACSMKNYNCDIVFDDKDSNINELKTNQAKEKILSYLYME
jgi:hypothetical protein